jgi:NAD(P)-dependent dehydrogenase (short-subunit alcohol dehydrogenase family)
MFNLHGKTAAITGAGSGIGRAIAQTFAAHGARAIVLDRDADAGQRVASEIAEADGSAEARALDVTDGEAVRQTIDAIVSDHRGLDILVNNAGIAHVGNLEQTTGADLDRLYAVNVKGPYHGMKAAVPHMVEAGGGVVLNLASIASLVGLKDRFAYSMSKGALLTMTYSVAADYVDQHVRCNCICPARVHTPFVDDFIKQNYPGQEQAMLDKLAGAQPIGRMGRPDEVAALALYLCSDEAGFVTGAAYPIDGGVTTLR